MKFLNYYNSVAVFLLSAVSLVVSSGYSLGAGMLVLGSLILLFKRPDVSFGRQEWMLCAVLAAYFLVCALEVYWDGQSSRGLDKPIRFLLAIPALYLLLAYPPRASFIWSGFAVGAISAGSWALWQRLIEEEARARGFTHVIQYGDINMLLGIMCIAGMGWASSQFKSQRWMWLLGAGAIMGILGSLMSGSRGGWVGFPIVLFVIYKTYKDFLPRKKLISLGAVIALAGVVLYAVPQTGVQHRVHAAFHDVAGFMHDGNAHSSLGARFEMWRGAIILIPEKPLFGHGSLGYEHARDNLIADNRLDPIVGNYGHVHNEYLDALLKRGAAGLVVLLLLYLVPLKLFAQRISSKCITLRSFALAGMLLPISYIDFGLSQVLLVHNSGVMMYAFVLVVLWAGLRQAEKNTP
ncbi:O-antigen ligase [Kushneria avicenniae]|uniref:O-antigen ligase n=1 Tax=Kushneria avicenniae TaxID=402385 RepID=A0A1I1I900_9GAMM|nr:O-antigen ligase family protein [Kushneria avicenniae]SFC32737.1 O-antigen ligase [Kushneria avicenniae]